MVGINILRFELMTPTEITIKKNDSMKKNVIFYVLKHILPFLRCPKALITASPISAPV